MNNKVIATILLLMGFALAVVYVSINWPYWKVERQVAAMQTDTAIQGVFGEPQLVFHQGKQNYYVAGYSYKERQITGRVEIYFPLIGEDSKHLDMILYVYYDRAGAIEDVYVGGS